MTNPINQTIPLESLSPKYALIRSDEIIRTFEAKGMSVTQTQSGKPRKASRQGFQKHIVRFRDHNTVPEKGDSFPEIVLINSHDGSNSLRLLVGIYRMVCANGMIAGSTYSDLRIRHTGDVQTRLSEAIDAIVAQFGSIVDQADRWSKVQLTQAQREELAFNAAKLVTPEKARIDLTSVLRPIRNADVGNDLWRTFNVVQETLVRGGTRYQSEVVDDNGLISLRNSTARGIKSVTKLVTINTSLWDIAEKIAA